MANSILKLNVESSEYDAKLKKAAEGIRHLADVAHRSGGDLTGLEKAELDYIRALGDMETKSRSAAGKTRELENAFKELTVVYNQLNDVEKSDEGGKALAASLEKLKKRALEAKDGLNEATKALKENEQAAEGDKTGIEGLTSALGLNLKSLVGWGTALAVGKAALDVAKDAFMQSESNIDDWGRAVQASEASYNVFLQTLNTGNWSGFFQNLNTAINGARELYNALDRLGSIKSNNAAAIAIVQQQIAQLRLMKQQGQNVDEQLKKATKNLANLQNQTVVAGKNAGRTMAAETIKNRFNAQGGNLAGSSANAVVERIMKNGQAEFDRQAKILADLTKAGTGTRDYGTYKVQGVFDLNNLTAEQQKQYKLAKAITEGETEIQKGIEIYAQAVSEGTSNAREQFKGNRYAAAGTGGKGGNKDKKEYDELQKVQQEIAKLTKEAYTADGKRVEEIQAEIAGLQEEERRLTNIRDLVTGRNNDPLRGIEAQYPDRSKQKYNTGYAGSAQSKYDSARQDFALGGISTSDISGFINLTKQAIAQSDIGSEMYTKLTEQMKDATTMSTLLNEMMERGVEGTDLTTMAEKMKAALLEGDIPDEKIKEFIEQMNEKISEQGGVELEYNGQTGEVKDKKSDKKDEDDLKIFNDSVGKLTGGMSQVTNGLKAVGVQIPKEVDDIIGVVNGVSQIITGVGTIISIFGTSAMTANTTAVTLNTASIGALIAAIEVNTATNLIPGLSGGGMAFGGKILHAATGTIVPGNYGFDAVPAMLTSGEVVLNHAQVGNLASQLEDNGRGAIGGETQPYLDGEKIFLGMQAYTRRSGLGEIVTSER